MFLGAIQKYDRKYSEAESLLKQALSVKPGSEDDAKILYILGKTYVSWGRPDDARSVLKQVVKTHPESPVAARARDTLAAIEKPRN
jgi:TolA-binding protein